MQTRQAPIDYSALPRSLQAAARRWIEEHQLPGHFLTAVIKNDLRDAVARADDDNIKCLRLILQWFYCDAPSGCHGSVENVEAWVNAKEKKTP